MYGSFMLKIPKFVQGRVNLFFLLTDEHLGMVHSLINENDASIYGGFFYH